SRQHLEILWEGDSVTARDLGSTNGSRLDGHTFTESALRPDAVLTIGHTRIVYRLVPRRGREEDARDGRAADPSALGDREPWERDDVEGPDSGDPFRANPYAEDGSEHEGLENPYRDDSRREGSAPGGREPWETEPPEPEGAGRDEGSGEEGSGREPWESEPGERQ
ncbi:MAG TPA: FHA domain-containing protein, partial [Microbacteriaceae bacterium]|nr:FHA domain-containing protein [Microbacteriaceae bacterium]